MLLSFPQQPCGFPHLDVCDIFREADSQNTKPDIPKNNNEDKDNANDQAESASSQIQPWIIVVIVVLAVVVAAVVVIILVRKRGSKEKNNKE